jgi:hypothetical protein
MTSLICGMVGAMIGIACFLSGVYFGRSKNEQDMKRPSAASNASKETRRQLMLEQARMDNFFGYDGSSQTAPEELIRDKKGKAR